MTTSLQDDPPQGAVSLTIRLTTGGSLSRLVPEDVALDFAKAFREAPDFLYALKVPSSTNPGPLPGIPEKVRSELWLARRTIVSVELVWHKSIGPTS